jgi:glucans biosynthesis protein C
MSGPAHDGAGERARIVGLDAWRAGLMMAGLFVHASFRLPPTWLSNTVEAASLAARMGVFFAISAFLAATILPRRDATVWLRRRVMTLGVPALFGLTVLSPLVWAMVTYAPPTHGRELFPYEWHHLWFLFALIGYSGCLAAIETADRRTALFARLDRMGGGSAATGRIVILLAALAGAALFGAAAPVLQALLSGAHLAAFANIQSIAGYLPMFLFGVVLARCPRQRAAVFAARGFAITVVIASAAAVLLLGAGQLSERVAEYVRFAIGTLCPPAAFALILRGALAIERITPFAKRVADASFTIYLLHLPIAVAFNVSAGRLFGPTTAYLLCVPVAGTLSYGAHRLVVRRSRTLSFLLNGKLPEAGLPQWTKRATTSR